MNDFKADFRVDINDDIRLIMKNMKIGKEPLLLVGSSSLQSQQYFGDYDLIQIVKIKKPKFDKIFKYVENSDNILFVEFKIQYLDGSKEKFYNLEDFKKISFKYDKIDFCKIDLLLWSNNRFYEVSIIYQFEKDDNSDSNSNSDLELIKSLSNDINELIKEGKYYKALKRQYSLASIKNNEKIMSELTKIFNSELGKQYARKSYLETIIKADELYGNDEDIKRLIVHSLKLYNEPTNINKVKNILNDLEKSINSNAKKLYDKIFKNKMVGGNDKDKKKKERIERFKRMIKGLKEKEVELTNEENRLAEFVVKYMNILKQGPNANVSNQKALANAQRDILRGEITKIKKEIVELERIVNHLDPPPPPAPSARRGLRIRPVTDLMNVDGFAEIDDSDDSDKGVYDY